MNLNWIYFVDLCGYLGIVKKNEEKVDHIYTRSFCFN